MLVLVCLHSCKLFYADIWVEVHEIYGLWIVMVLWWTKWGSWLNN